MRTRPCARWRLREADLDDGRPLVTVRIMPYRTLDNVIQGAVITFVDITATKELESRLCVVQSQAEHDVDGSKEQAR